MAVWLPLIVDMMLLAVTKSARFAAVAVLRFHAVPEARYTAASSAEGSDPRRRSRGGPCGPRAERKPRPPTTYLPQQGLERSGGSDLVHLRRNLNSRHLWQRTQIPDLHERWDLRFTSIEYLERADGSAALLFRYATRIGFVKEIEGWGETVGEQVDPDTRVSAFKFGYDVPFLLIRAGLGYWKHERVGDGVRFITGYDYDVRWGPFGPAVDGLVFRPLLGWAMAWSLDRLRLWKERGLEPGQAARQAHVHALASATIAFT